MLLGHFFIPASSTIEGSLNHFVLLIVVVVLEVSFLFTIELLLVLAPTPSFIPRGVMGSGTDISGSSTVFPVQDARLFSDNLVITLSALEFWANISFNEGFALLKAAELCAEAVLPHP